ncbi:MAG: hypothetical protein ACTHNU_00240 [Gaiellales bacterium]
MDDPSLMAARRALGRSSVQCTVVGLVVAAAIAVFGPPGVDRPAHLFQTWAYAHAGLQIWNNYWYAGRYQFVTYSLLFYPLASLIGITPLAVGSAGLLSGSFGALARRRWGRTAGAPALVFAVSATAVLMVFGMYPFLTGLALATAGLVAARRASWAVFALFALGSAAASPLAFLMLLVALATRVAGDPRPLGVLRRYHRHVVVVGVLLSVAAVWARVFSSASFYAYAPSDLAIVVAFTAAGLYLTGIRGRAADLRAFFVVYLLLNVGAFLIPSPVGSNAIRLFTIGGAPILWIAARAGRLRSRPQVAVIVACALAVQVAPAVADAYSAGAQPAASPAFWTPVIRFLAAHRRPVSRVEVVATWGHWEAYYLAKDGVSLARGWYRQDDYPENQVLYRGDELTPRAYRKWLHRMGVRYVLLPAGALDYTAQSEAALLRSGRSGLSVVARLPNWTVYGVPHPTALLSAATPGAATLTRVDAADVRIDVRRPGTFLLRIRYTPYWHAPSGVCLSATRDGMTIVRTSVPGDLRLTIDGSITAVETALTGGGDNSCAPGAVP